MKLSDLPSIGIHELPAEQTLFRVQSASTHATTESRGAVRLHAGPSRLGRFDLADLPTAYFATLPQTALHEAVYRKNLHKMRLDALEDRELIAVATNKALRLVDLRPYASHLPVLLSVRQEETRELARDVHEQGFDGLISRSAQQGEHDCVILFDPPGSWFRLLWRSLLSEDGGTGQAWAVVADRSARIQREPSL